MVKAVGSKKNLLELPFYSYISDIFENEEIQKLGKFTHHIYTTRLQHSLNVSYYNYLICKFFRLNAVAAARAGLMHDMFYYNRKEYIKENGKNRIIQGIQKLRLKMQGNIFILTLLKVTLLKSICGRQP